MWRNPAKASYVDTEEAPLVSARETFREEIWPEIEEAHRQWWEDHGEEFHAVAAGAAKPSRGTLAPIRCLRCGGTGEVEAAPRTPGLSYDPGRWWRDQHTQPGSGLWVTCPACLGTCYEGACAHINERDTAEKIRRRLSAIDPQPLRPTILGMPEWKYRRLHPSHKRPRRARAANAAALTERGPGAP